MNRTFTMALTPSGLGSSVLLDNVDIMKHLRGVSVHSNVETGTSVELIPKHGALTELIVQLPESQVLITDEAAPLSTPSTVAVGDRIVFDVELIRLLEDSDRHVLAQVIDIQTSEDGVKTLVLEESE